MAITEDQIQRFTDEFKRFATEKLRDGDAESVQELIDLWRLENPTAEEHAETLASIQRGVEDANAGRTVPAADAFAEARNAIFKRQ